MSQTEPLQELSPDQEALIPVVRDEWLNPLFGLNGPAQLDKEKCKDGIEWLYQLIGLDKPIIFFLDSPLGCQLAANILKKSSLINQHDQKFDQVEKKIVEKIRTEINDQIEEVIKTKIYSYTHNYIEYQILAQIDRFHFQCYHYFNQVGNQICNWDPIQGQLHDQFWTQIEKQAQEITKEQVENELLFQVLHEFTSQWDEIYPLGYQFRNHLGDEIKKIKDLEYFSPGWRDFMFDADYGAINEYWTRIGIINHENTNKYIEYLKSYPGYVIFLKGFVFVCGLPREIHRDVEGRLHCETGPALSWEDGYSQYYWHGISIPRRWINEPLSITSEDFLTESNAERRRALHEILGTDRLTEILELETVDIKEVPFQTWDQEGFLEACQTGELGKEMVNFTEEEILTTPEKILPYYDLFIKTNIQTIVLLQTTDKVDGDEKASFIEVRCPSTGEIFHLGVPSDFTDASKARAWTLYEDEKIGDFET